MKRILIIISALLALTACQESLEERAARDAREITAKKCPMPLGNDGNVIMERVEFDIPTRTWKEDLLLDFPEEGVLDQAEIRDVLIGELKNTPSYKPYMDAGFNFKYVYCRMSNPQDTLINLMLTKEDYK
ncbi:MAG: membrane lipoprotein lipid attachment site-containing protein [Prevotella sp.]|nr:membrane lipoprotein lipid attachment site-containing protein [Prevotella sp.]